MKKKSLKLDKKLVLGKTQIHHLGDVVVGGTNEHCTRPPSATCPQNCITPAQPCTTGVSNCFCV